MTAKTGGRQKGTQNKISVSVKENIIAVFNKLHGTAGMAAWARKNQTEFYKLYARLAPTSVDVGVTVRDEQRLSDAEIDARIGELDSRIREFDQRISQAVAGTQSQGSSEIESSPVH